MTRPTRYRENNSSRDWIDEFCATKSAEEVRGAFLFNLGKYQRRYGKKDDHLQEALKIQDYANRLVEYERSLVKPIIRELYTEAEESRMDVVGQNGNTAEHYQAEDWIPNNGKKPDLPNGTIVQVMFANGCTAGGCTVDSLVWERDDSDDDITRYRVLRPEHEWIPSNGKKPDLPDGTLVDARFTDGDVVIGRSTDCGIWTQDGEPDDITHYRIHQPE